MKSHPTQFGVRENTASSRQHDSRLTRAISPSVNHPQTQNPRTQPFPTHEERSATTSKRPQYAGSDYVATEGETARDDDSPLTVKEAAKYLGVSPQSVYLWVERKQIPHLRVMGRNIRFLRSDLEPFRASFKQEMENGKTS